MGQHSINNPLKRVARNGACLVSDSRQLVKETAHNLDHRISHTIQIVDDGISSAVLDARLGVSDLSQYAQQKVQETAPIIKTAVVDELRGSYEKAMQTKDNAGALIQKTAQNIDAGLIIATKDAKLEVYDLSQYAQQKVKETVPKIKTAVIESSQIVKSAYGQYTDILKPINYSRTGKAVVVGVFVVNGLVQSSTVNSSSNIKFDYRNTSSQFDNFQLTAYKNSKVDSDSSGFIRQVAQYGQTVWTLGQQDGFSVSQWSGVNPGVNPNNILAGQAYNIPTPSTPESTPTIAASNEVPSTSQTTNSVVTPQPSSTPSTPESTPTIAASNEVPSTSQTTNSVVTPQPSSTPSTPESTPTIAASNEVPSTSQTTNSVVTPQPSSTPLTPESTPTIAASNEVPSTQNVTPTTTPQSPSTPEPLSSNQPHVIFSHNPLVSQPSSTPLTPESTPTIAASNEVPSTQNVTPTTTPQPSNQNLNIPNSSGQNKTSIPGLNPAFINPNPLSISSLKINNPINTLEGSVTMQEIITYFQKNSTLNDTAIAGIVGNLNYESSLNTERYENTFPANTLTPANSLTTAELNNSSMGWGLAQETPAEKIIGWAQNQNLNPNLMSTQAQFIIDNIQNSPTLYEKLMAATNPSDAAYIFMEYYEMPSNYNSAPFREAYANQAFSLIQH